MDRALGRGSGNKYKFRVQPPDISGLQPPLPRKDTKSYRSEVYDLTHRRGELVKWTSIDELPNQSQSNRSALKVGSSGGRSSKTSTVIRTANTPSENALSRSGVARHIVSCASRPGGNWHMSRQIGRLTSLTHQHIRVRGPSTGFTVVDSHVEVHVMPPVIMQPWLRFVLSEG
jgi:hypothetical protein